MALMIWTAGCSEYTANRRFDNENAKATQGKKPEVQ